jgi:hypothetical protein
MKASLLSFVFNNFSESRLFNALEAIQVEKSLSFAASIGMRQTHAQCTSRVQRDRPVRLLVEGKYNSGFDFLQRNVLEPIRKTGRVRASFC